MATKEITNILNQSLDQVMSDRFGRYSKYIIQDRALPDARDGLKPVQRRILYSMNDLGLHFNKPFKKSARVVGDVIGKYHPHGDSSIYEAMVRMSQDWKMNVPLIEMHGNNGSIDDDPAAAMRYTEARLTEIAHTLINNLKKETVLFAPNFDDSEKEPTVLPALLPNLLLNGAKGIAAGYATEIPPHNLNEIIDAIIAKIKSPNIRFNTLLSHIHGPDFPTGGIIQGKDGIYQAFEHGRGKIVVRSKYEIIKSKSINTIIISEIPYGVVKAKLVRQIDEIRFNNKIEGIKDVRDESGRQGIRICIELSKKIAPEPVVNYLLSKTDFQIYYNYNVIAIKNKAPIQMSLVNLIDAYLDHQKNVQKKALSFDLNKFKTRLEIIIGLIRVAEIADEIIEEIRKVQGSKQGVVKMLETKFKFTSLQANAIADLKLYRLSQTDQEVYLKEKAELEIKIAHIEKLLNNSDAFDKYLIELLKELKQKYGKPRKTTIEETIEQISIDMEDLIKHENVWVGISKDGYIKRFSNKAYEANQLEDYELKTNDALKYFDYINTQDKLLVFTSGGNYFFLPVHKIHETKFKDVGKHINDFGSLKPEETIVDAIAVSDFSLLANIVLVTKKGKAKAVKIKDFEVSRYSKSYQAFKLSTDDQLIGARVSNGFKQIVIVNNQGKAVRYSEKMIPIQGLNASGAKSIALRPETFATAFTIGQNQDIVGMISKRGGIKRIRMENISLMAKTTQGKPLFKALKYNPHILLQAKIVDPSDTIGFFTTNKFILNRFGDVDITTSEEGMSLAKTSQAFDGLIFKFEKINQENVKKGVNETLTDEEKFAKAEQEIDQLSLDDLLKKL